VPVRAAAAPVMASAIIRPVRHAEHTVDRTDRAADAGSNRATDHSADRSCGAIALVGPLLRTADDALRLTCMGQSKQGQGQRSSAE
jgi:hypothetical protein